MFDQTVDLSEMKRQLEAIFDEYNQQLERRIPQCKAIEKERLKQFGISGSAVKPNLEESQTWQVELKKIRSEYDSKIIKLKENIPPR